MLLHFFQKENANTKNLLYLGGTKMYLTYERARDVVSINLFLKVLFSVYFIKWSKVITLETAKPIIYKKVHNAFIVQAKILAKPHVDRLFAISRMIKL